jgi:hypothetical protein
MEPSAGKLFGVAMGIPFRWFMVVEAKITINKLAR